MHPKYLSISNFTYDLPEDRIANFPLNERDQSRLLIYKSSIIGEDIYQNIAEHLPGNSLLIFNNTRVIEARLLFVKPSGGTIEIFCLEPIEKQLPLELALATREKVIWKCLVGGASKWKPGQILEKVINTSEEQMRIQARLIRKEQANFIIELSWAPASLSFIEVLHQIGAIPLPPYIKRKAELADAQRYQTIYARFDGSVAAPTAGLHFTDRILNSLKEKKIATDFLTLHVGAGTFKPVKVATMEAHEMHAEFIEVSKELVEHLIEKSKYPIIAVGTTSLRTLESLYWLGMKLKAGQFTQPETNAVPTLEQWEPYDNSLANIASVEALQYILLWMRENNTERMIAKTQIIIAPGYRPKIVKGLITNFHQPQSTLLLLIAALVGKDWKKIYNYALEHDYRFLSYGDGCLLWASETA